MPPIARASTVFFCLNGVNNVGSISCCSRISTRQGGATDTDLQKRCGARNSTAPLQREQDQVVLLSRQFLHPNTPLKIIQISYGNCKYNSLACTAYSTDTFD